MAATPISTSLPREVVQAVDTIIHQCANTSLEVLFKRRMEVPDENRIKRNIAFAVLTGAGFDSPTSPTCGGFGNFATEACKRAVLELQKVYVGTPQVDTRDALYKLFKQKLDASFGKEFRDTIPASLPVKQVTQMRKYLYLVGYSLNMARIYNGKPHPPTPFSATTIPLAQIQEGRQIELPNDWIVSRGERASDAIKEFAFRSIYQAILRGEETAPHRFFQIHEVERITCRCPSSFKELIGIFFCRIPLRLRSRDGNVTDGIAFRF